MGYQGGLYSIQYHAPSVCRSPPVESETEFLSRHPSNFRGHQRQGGERWITIKLFLRTGI